MCTYCVTPIAKWLCDTPLVILPLKFHNLHPFLIYTPTPSVYAHPIFNCVFELALLFDPIRVFIYPKSFVCLFIPSFFLVIFLSV